MSKENTAADEIVVGEESNAPRTEIGKVIARQEELGLTDQQIADALGLTKQSWNKARNKYKKEGGNYKYSFSSTQLERLNQLLGFSLEEAMGKEPSPMIFDEPRIFSKALEEAKSRDYVLTLETLRCIADASEEDLLLLNQTVNVLIRHLPSYDKEFASILLSVIRNSVTRSVQKLLPNDAKLQSLIEEKLKTATEKRKKRACGQYRDKCYGQYNKDNDLDSETSGKLEYGTEVQSQLILMRVAEEMSNHIIDVISVPLKEEIRRALEYSIQKELSYSTKNGR